MSVLRLDSALENSFSQLMLQGRALQLHIKTLHLQQQALPASNSESQASLARALSRLAGLSSRSWVRPSTRTRKANRSQTTRKEPTCTNLS